MAVKSNTLRYGPLGPACVHLCVDMQRMFAEETPWKTPWMQRVLPKVVQLVGAHPTRTLFTRFVPLAHAEEGAGTWRRYYQRWSEMTLQRLDHALVDLVPELAIFVPPAQVMDKRVYSPWPGGELHRRLQAQHIDTLVVSGGETDVCVLSTVLGAVDHGYRIVLATDALCSSSDETHDALLTVYENRYTQQVEAVPTEEILRSWPAAPSS